MSAGKGIIVVRTPVTATTFRTKKDRQAEATAVAKSVRVASYAKNRLITYAPGGIPMYATGHGKMGRGEVKFFDCAVTAPAGATFGLFAPSTPPTGSEPAVNFTGITELNCVGQGATSYNRIGTKILIKSIMFNSIFSLTGSGPTQSTFRYMIVYDHQPNGAFPAFSDILSQNIGTAPIMFSSINMSNRSRFIVLRDRVHTLDFDGGNGGTIHCKEFIKTKLETQFGTNTATIGDITSGAIYLIAFAVSGTAVSYVTMTNASSRIRYFD